jgi:hypothetical protein
MAKKPGKDKLSYLLIRDGDLTQTDKFTDELLQGALDGDYELVAVLASGKLQKLDTIEDPPKWEDVEEEDIEEDD